MGKARELKEMRDHLEGDRKWESRATVNAVEVRESGEMCISGNAAVFDSDSEEMWGMIEQIKRGAFRKVLASKPDVRLLINHDGAPFARTTTSTLRLKETPKGLEFEAELDPADPEAVSLYRKVASGNMDQMSFAFRVADGGDEWVDGDDAEGGLDRRYITEISHLYEVSVVTFPAYGATSAQVSRTDEPESQESRGGSEQQPDAGGDSDGSSTQPDVSDQAERAYEARRRDLLTLGVHEHESRNERSTRPEAGAS